MDKKDANNENLKKQLEEKVGDSKFYSALFDHSKIPIETLMSMSANMTMQEFMREMDSRGLEIHISAKRKRTHKRYLPSKAEMMSFSLNALLDSTEEERSRYLKLREQAREKMGDTGFIEAFMEHEMEDPESPLDMDALTDLNTASYQGDFGQLKTLSQNLKHKEEEEQK